MKMSEIRDIPGFPNYGADRKGNVYSYNYRGTGKTKMLKPCHHTEGYSIVTLFADGKQKVCYVHRLIAKTFIPNTKNKKMLDHINHDKKDNRVENLRWVTREENAWNSKATGTTYIKSRNSWMARITKRGETTYLGHFETQEEAHAAYKAAKKILHIID
jgi:hypothetical protein